MAGISGRTVRRSAAGHCRVVTFLTSGAISFAVRSLCTSADRYCTFCVCGGGRREGKLACT